MQQFSKAHQLLKQFKGDSYLSGYGSLDGVGRHVKDLGGRAALVRDTFPGSDGYTAKIRESLHSAGIELAGIIGGAAQNAPREDVFRITKQLSEIDPDFQLELKKKCRQEVENLSNLLDRDLLSEWGYNNLENEKNK